MTPVRIADELNARGVPGPRDRLGRKPRFAVIEIAAAAYIGVMVFNRLIYRKISLQNVGSHGRMRPSIMS
jgi:hypothetical protein